MGCKKETLTSPIQTVKEDPTGSVQTVKEDLVSSNDSRTSCDTIFDYVTYYYYENVRVLTPTYDPYDETLFPQIVVDSITNCKVFFSFYAFSSRQNAIDWGFSNNLPVANIYEIEDRLSYLADSSGISNLNPETDSIPQWYLDYCNDFVERTFSSDFMNPNNNSRVVSWMFMNKANPSSAVFVNGAYGSGSWLPVGLSVPTLTFSYNNSLSAYRNELLMATLKPYDKWFYKNPFPNVFFCIGCLFPSGNATVNFSGPLAPLDNKISSFFHSAL